MIENQGDLILLIERDDRDSSILIKGYVCPQNKEKFDSHEVRDLYLAQAVGNTDLEDDEREKVYKYFQQNVRNTVRTKAQFTEEVPVTASTENKGVTKVVLKGKNPTPKTVLVGKKYKPVADKVRPVYQDLPEKFRIVRDIKGNPLEGMPEITPHPPEFVPTGRYTQERKDGIDKAHEGNFLWPEERKLVHQVFMQQNEAFAWDDTEKGSFRTDFFPPVDIPVVEHTPWVLKNIPIPPGMYERVCEFIATKIKAGTYEPSSSSYRSRWFTVTKKDGVSFRIVHSLEPLNAVTIAHSGLPPAADSLAEHFSGRACGGILDLYVGYDERLLAESSRDLTTFQTPFGALRLVTLPMGWTNSVPIFHEDVTYILRDEMPDYTEPYIDDVPVRGPKNRYELPNGGYEVIKENKGIRRFVWEHMINVNRIVQRMKYCGGTFSGKKSILCAAEIVVVGHLCTYKGRKPAPDKVHTILNWGPCKNISDVRAFMGTMGLLRIYISDYAKRAEHIQRLLRGKEPFVWGKNQQESMNALKEGAKNANCVKPLDYLLPGPITLAVDTSWRAVGFYIYQQDPSDKKKKVYARFGSILLTEREQRFSQPKRELYGLLRALQACYYWLIGARKLVVETDALYLKGMLDNPGMGPNATVNRWIDKILMYHFQLKHVAGKSFGPDGLSRREGQPGDEEFEHSEENDDGKNGPLDYVKPNEFDPDPLPFEDFKEQIDTRGGYLMEGNLNKILKAPLLGKTSLLEAISVKCFQIELQSARKESIAEKEVVKELLQEERVPNVQREFLHKYILAREIPTTSIDNAVEEEYDTRNRTSLGIDMDDKLPMIKYWLQNPKSRPPKLDERQYQNFIRTARNFFLDKEGQLYRRAIDEAHKLVMDQKDRTRMMRAAHDSLGHRGSYATRKLLAERFWWPEYERDVHWYVKTCHVCQLRQKTLIQIPRTETHTPSIFQQLHVDTMHMTPPSNGHSYVVHGRCALTSWVEGRTLRKENAHSIADWLFEDILCRWGCLREIITDNGGPFVAAVKYLERKYGIHGITISAYNSRANGKIERPHWDIRQMLVKACGTEEGAIKRWSRYFYHVLWADRVTIRKGFGCSPFFLVTGAHPVLPFDIVEATWLVQLPDRVLTTEELIGFRARALAKHRNAVEDMRARVSKNKRDAMRTFERKHAAKIKDYVFKPGEVVLMRNTGIESSLNKKMSARWNGPYIVIVRKDGGAYLVAEMDGSVLKDKIAAFRLVPYFARRRLKLPENLDTIIDQTKENLRKMLDVRDDEPAIPKDYIFNEPGVSSGNGYLPSEDEGESEDGWGVEDS